MTTPYYSNKKKGSRYCSVEAEGGFISTNNNGDEWKPVIQYIHVYEENEDRLRFAYYWKNNFIPRPLEIAEETLPELFEGAFMAKVISIDTLYKIVEKAVATNFLSQKEKKELANILG